MSARTVLLLPGIAVAFALAVHCAVAMRSPQAGTSPPPSSIQSIHAIIGLPTEKEIAWLEGQAAKGAKVRLIHDSPEITPETIPGVAATRSQRSEAWTEGALLNAVCFVPRANIPHSSPSRPSRPSP